MLLNIALLFLVFGATKKKVSPYVAALVLGVTKFVIYAVFSKSVIVAVIMGVLYGGSAGAFVYFLKRLDQREDRERPEVPNYRPAGSATITFRWEYIPLVVLLILIVWGELLLA